MAEQQPDLLCRTGQATLRRPGEALQLLPASLRPSASAFLHMLETLPESEPAACPHCGGRQRTVRCAKGPRCRRTLYECSRCGSTYNVLTGTALARLLHPRQWRPYMELRFAGWSLHPIADALGISLHATSTWDRRFLDAMRRDYPALHAWWQAHQDREEVSQPEPLQDQSERFIAWVAAMADGDPATRAPATSARLEGTPFYRLAFKPLWPSYARLLIDGASDADVSRELGISAACSYKWRRRFLQAMADRAPDLLPWVQWQRARRYCEVSEAAAQP